MDMPAHFRAMLDTACAQRNQAQDAVIELNGQLVAARAEVYALREQLAEIQAPAEPTRG